MSSNGKRSRPEPVEVVKLRRDTTLAALVDSVPYIKFLGIRVERHGDELTTVLPFADKLIGNPLLPAIHGGVTAAFLESAAVFELTWVSLWADMESGKLDPDTLGPDNLPDFPKTIDFSIDYLRSGLPRDAYARARIVRQGRRYASVHVEAWQDNRTKLYAQATGHFLMPTK
ncbi:PaaI family thioesterase [Aliiroseovarius sp. 2305UL8-7]|uniref:PaaI family thioesterase n=1 Tax=Aliiroseovarius conchicola TaxID=3121637 RepID=UPI00352896E7